MLPVSEPEDLVRRPRGWRRAGPCLAAQGSQRLLLPAGAGCQVEGPAWLVWKLPCSDSPFSKGL